MWKCKNCGGERFYENIVGGFQESQFDKNGECIAVIDQEIEYEEVCCKKCDNTGDCVQDIAEWVDD